MLQRCLAITAVLAVAIGIANTIRAAEDAAATAREVDRLLVAGFPAGTTPAPLANDEDFLRRASLDLAGRVPTPNEVTLFGLNPDPDKRARLIDKLLASNEYARIWASYWTDVVFLRATEQRSQIM